jgi:hypothetical protein
VLSWVVTCRSTLRRSRKSHSLCVLPRSTRAASGGMTCPRRSDAHFASRMALRDVSLLECAVVDKHRVLPVFGRNRPHSSPLECALISHLITVDSKWLTAELSPLECAVTKNEGVSSSSQGFFSFRFVSMCLRGDPSSASGHGTRVTGPSVRQSHCSALTLVPQWGKARTCRQPRETYPPQAVSKDSERTSGTARSWSPLQVVPRDNVLTQSAF